MRTGEEMEFAEFERLLREYEEKLSYGLPREEVSTETWTRDGETHTFEQRELIITPDKGAEIRSSAYRSHYNHLSMLRYAKGRLTGGQGLTSPRSRRRKKPRSVGFLPCRPLQRRRRERAWHTSTMAGSYGRRRRRGRNIVALSKILVGM